MEWARLLLQVDVAAGTPGARTDAAVALFDRAVADGWDGEHGGGFVYTVDWSGTPVEPRRYHWVAAEAVAAADVLGRVTGDPRFAEAAAGWWAWIDEHLVDHGRGSWHHELDTANRPDGVTWVGKPDVYHAAQAVILPDLPLTGSLAASAKAAGSILG
nr:AGE family epimerase/isomerase [Cellulosimicrobium sp. MM]